MKKHKCKAVKPDEPADDDADMEGLLDRSLDPGDSFDQDGDSLP